MAATASKQHDGIDRTCETCGHCGLERTDYPCRCCIRTHGQADMYQLDEDRVQRVAKRRAALYDHIAQVWSRYLDGAVIVAEDVEAMDMIAREIARREGAKE